MRLDKKFVMIITSEDKRYPKEKQLTYFAEHPYNGLLVDVRYGNTFDELIDGCDYEGLFYQLYHAISGTKIASGIIDPDTPREEIEEFNISQKRWAYFGSGNLEETGGLLIRKDEDADTENSLYYEVFLYELVTDSDNLVLAVYGLFDANNYRNDKKITRKYDVNRDIDIIAAAVKEYGIFSAEHVSFYPDGSEDHMISKQNAANWLKGLGAEDFLPSSKEKIGNVLIEKSVH